MLQLNTCNCFLRSLCLNFPSLLPTGKQGWEGKECKLFSCLCKNEQQGIWMGFSTCLAKGSLWFASTEGWCQQLMRLLPAGEGTDWAAEGNKDCSFISFALSSVVIHWYSQWCEWHLVFLHWSWISYTDTHIHTCWLWICSEKPSKFSDPTSPGKCRNGKMEKTERLTLGDFCISDREKT